MGDLELLPLNGKAGMGCICVLAHICTQPFEKNCTYIKNIYEKKYSITYFIDFMPEL